MLTLTNSYHEGKCCAICRYWYGDAVAQYDSKTGSVVYESETEEMCEHHGNITKANDLCEHFQTEYIYSRYFDWR